MAAIGTRSLTLDIDGTPYEAAVSSCVISSKAADSDFVSFFSAASGGSRQYSLKLTALQDANSASLWSKVWSQAGMPIDVVVKPYGNFNPTTDQPHYSGTVTIVEPDGDFLGGDADTSTSALFTFDVEWIFTDKPVAVTS